MKQIKNITLVLVAVTLFYSCTDNQETKGTNKSDKVEITFTAGGLQIAPVASQQPLAQDLTRTEQPADGVVNMPAGTTFCAIAYTAADAELTDAEPTATDLTATALEGSYQITEAGGVSALSPLYLPRGMHNLYYFSPASSFLSGKAENLTNGVDYMTAGPSTQEVVPDENSQFRIGQVQFARLCSRIDIRITPTESSTITKLAIGTGGAEITGLAMSATYTPGGATLETSGTEGISQIDAANFTSNTDTELTTQDGKGFIVLPVSQQDITFNVDLVVNGTSTPVNAVLSGKTLAAGYKYLLDLKVGRQEPLTFTFTATPWKEGDPITDTNPTPGIALGAYYKGGIVYWIDETAPTHCKIVSLDQAACPWEDAKAWVATYATDWRLPDVYELKDIYKARAAIQGGMLANGGIAFDAGTYWSLSEEENGRAQAVSFATGGTATELTSQATRLAVRAVKEFGERNLSVNGTANCYIANNRCMTYTFDATKKGNGIATDGTTMGDVITPGSVKIFWQTGKVVKASSLRLIDNNTKVHFQLNDDFKPEDGGSALIAVYDNENPDAAGAKILWSWHIWVTDYNPDAIVRANKGMNLEANNYYTAPDITGQVHTYGTGYMNTNPGKVIMDRNLGAEKTSYTEAPSANDNWLTYGFVYQWGRKDPFFSDTKHKRYDATGTQEVTYSVMNGSVEIEQTVLHPESFIKAGSNNDWVTLSNDHLWNSTAGTKTAYDPCPPGWRVPVIGTWDDFKAGSSFKDTDRFYSAGNISTWYSAGGLIYPQGNIEATDNKYGYSRSSTPATNNTGRSYFLFFTNPNHLDVRNSNSRAYGLATRCIQE